MRAEAQNKCETYVTLRMSNYNTKTLYCQQEQIQKQTKDWLQQAAYYFIAIPFVQRQNDTINLKIIYECSLSKYESNIYIIFKQLTQTYTLL